MITIVRTHEIAAGHRVYGHESKCAHLHGHNYGFELTAAAEALDSLGRVVDFSVLKARVCQWLEEHWDHRMVLNAADPLCDVLEAAGEPIVRLPFNPTAERLAEYVGRVVGPQTLDGTGVSLVQVRVWETGKCAATWSVAAPTTITLEGP
jgi:6-pyruvoyltetrahydropterin/6-carboxytetrahydropterin synthase